MDFEIRKDRSTQGRRKLHREREAYFELMRQGVSNLEASRIVGIHYRTGRGWRNGRRRSNDRPAAPPISPVVSQASPSRYLQEKDRIHIANRVRERASIRAIARELGRAPSTISREIRRNGTPHQRAVPTSRCAISGPGAPSPTEDGEDHPDAGTA
jgi:IS30 family transposase